jgi:D-psicose/D-tagatose/L-ribulose 3-epimerase
MKTGMNLFLWTDDPTDPSLLPLYERLKAMGFDGLELPLFGPKPEAFAELGRRLEDMGLERTAVTVCSAEADPISSDPAVRRAAADHLAYCIDCCEASGASLLGGPLYAALGVFSGEGPTDEERARSVEVLQQAADRAAAAGVELVLEFLNRFEIYLLNGTEDATKHVAAIDRPNCGVHYDTFHAHIEEKDPVAAIEAAGAAIRHVHVSENDRSTPGRGQVAWGDTFRALRRIGYDGWLTIEAFGSAIPSLAAATKIWRPLFDDEETLAREGLHFMERSWARAGGGER